ncbi:MAG: uridine kinase family protein [Jatrophihabitans sp.]
MIAAVHRLPRERTSYVGIDGYGGAGKTTLAAAVALAVPDVVVIHVDDFAAPQLPGWDWARFERQVAAPLRADRPARYQRWAFERNEGAEWRDVPTGRIVVIEGVSSTRREVGVAWDLQIWLDAPLSTWLARARARDGEQMMARWLEDWIPSENAYVADQRPQERVDLIVQSS